MEAEKPFHSPGVATPIVTAPPPPRTFRRFALRLTLFWLPVIVVIACGLELVLWRSGETWPIQRVLDFQAAHPDYVFMRKHIGQDLYSYKWAGLVRKRPEIVVLGSSRVMKFRAEMFGLTSAATAPAQFYNCGGLVQSTDDLENLLKMLPEGYKPKVVIIGLDLWWFNGNFRDGAHIRTATAADAALDWRLHVNCCRQLLKSPKEFREALSAPQRAMQQHGIGLGTVAGNGMGFRADGSLRGNHEELPIQNGVWKFIDAEKPPVKDRVKSQNGQFIPTDGLCKERLQQLERALREFHKQGITVIAILPPVADEVATLLDESPGQHGLWQAYQNELPGLLKRLDVPLLDSSTPAKIGLDDRYMMDGFHGEEVFHLHQLKELLKRPEVALLFPDASPFVESALASSRTNFWFPQL